MTRILTVLILAIAFAGTSVHAQCKQFGGDKQDFKVSCKKLSYEWPKDGPPVLWSRDLGEGYSAILADGEVLYTMYRKGDRDHIAAFSAKRR
ncbi:MAG: hypothetical protein IPK83_05540 [Planctomycetes bacterium]|nr:hypothetical protein [Planctomycetota bacterium]